MCTDPHERCPTNPTLPSRVSPTPAPEPTGSAASAEPRGEKPKRRRRAAVWTLIVFASVLLVLSITANWVQRELLDTDQVVDTTDEILDDEDIQQALSTYTVDQLYANVDVQGQIEQRLPSGAAALAVPAAAATRQLALTVEQRALASPRVQSLVSGAVGGAHGQFVSLIRDEDEYVSTTGSEVTLEYGEVIADLATRLGVDPETISEVQGVVEDFSTDLQRSLTTAQAEIRSARASLNQVRQGELSADQSENLKTVRRSSAELDRKIASLEEKIKGVKGSVPSQLRGALSDIESRLSELNDQLASVEEAITVVLRDPSERNVATLDSASASVNRRIDALLGRQVVQHPGELVLMDSDQLDGVQTLVGALRNLGFVLPVLAFLLYIGALILAKGWRREALIAAGGGILVATLLVLVARRLIGSEVVDSVAGSDTVEPAINSVWDILSDGLRERALFVLVIGVAFVGAGLLAGPGRHAVAVRRFLAPYLSDRPVVVYAVVAVLFLLWLAFIPGIENLGQVVAIVGLAALAVIGIELLRQQTGREFPPHANSS
jgi:hypothetical protein